MPKPINSQTAAAQQAAQRAAQQKEQQSHQKIEIGGVKYDRCEVSDYKNYTQNGQTRHSVFLKTGVKLDYPTQNNSSKYRRVGSISGQLNDINGINGMDTNFTSIFNLDNATITGNHYRDDYISLNGESSNNTIVLDEDYNEFMPGAVSEDEVELGLKTSNNTVKMDEKDHLKIEYHDKDNAYGQDILDVDGAGTSEQEVQLEHDLGEDKYNYHKNQQE